MYETDWEEEYNLLSKEYEELESRLESSQKEIRRLHEVIRNLKDSLQVVDNNMEITSDMIICTFKNTKGLEETFKIMQFFDLGDIPIRLNEIVGRAEEQGYESGKIVVTANNPLSGTIYEYNAGMWRISGTTNGYA